MSHGMPWRALGAWLLLMVSLPPLAGAQSPAGLAEPPVPAGCTSEHAVTTPAPVDLAEVLRDIYALEDTHHAKLFAARDGTLEAALAALFDPAVPKSKLEQFYTMLFYLAQHAAFPDGEVTIEVTAGQRLLQSSKVFSDPEFPRRIVQIRLSRKDPARPHYQVTFDRPVVWLPLNGGQGFGVYREGMCQHAKALVFYGGFSFSLARKGRALQVDDFDKVDLWGAFGTRGLLTLDINYVSVKSVEFENGNALGLVRGKVSRKEFAVNPHSFLLELVTRFVTDSSRQPIDW